MWSSCCQIGDLLLAVGACVDGVCLCFFLIIIVDLVPVTEPCRVALLLESLYSSLDGRVSFEVTECWCNSSSTVLILASVSLLMPTMLPMSSVKLGI